MLNNFHRYRAHSISRYVKAPPKSIKILKNPLPSTSEQKGLASPKDEEVMIINSNDKNGLTFSPNDSQIQTQDASTTFLEKRNSKSIKNVTFINQSTFRMDSCPMSENESRAARRISIVQGKQYMEESRNVVFPRAKSITPI